MRTDLIRVGDIWSLKVAAGWGKTVAAAPAAVLGPQAALRSAAGLPSSELVFCIRGREIAAEAVENLQVRGTSVVTA